MSASAELVAVDEAVAMIDTFLRVIAAVRETKPRDPLRAVEDVLLEQRKALADWP